MSALKRWFTVNLSMFFRRALFGDLGVYVVAVVDQTTKALQPVTFTATYAEAKQAIAREQYFDAFPYYAADCLDRGESIGFEQLSWQRYIQEHPFPLRTYNISHMRYQRNQFASVLRQLLGEEPLYLPYEQPGEALRYFMQVRVANNGKIVCSKRTNMIAEHDLLYRKTIEKWIATEVARAKAYAAKKDK